MKRLRIFFRDFFGFSKTEANAAIVLIAIVLLVAVLPRVYIRLAYNREAIPQDSTSLLAWFEEVQAATQPAPAEEIIPEEEKHLERFPFDPNNASVAQLELLGFSKGIATRIINYREAGGRFGQWTDLYRIYGIDSLLVSELRPLVQINQVSVPEAGAPVAPISTVVPASDEAEPAPPVSTLNMDLNEATAQELQEIRGIGPYYSERVVKYRDALGGYSSLDQLKEVYGLKPEAVDLLKSHTFIGKRADKNILINSDSTMLLAKHPYLKWNQAQAITSYRKQHGDYKRPEDIKNIKIISDSLFQKLLPYLSLDK